MRLGDGAGAADHGGDAGALEQAGFGAEGHQRRARLAGQALRQLHRRARRRGPGRPAPRQRVSKRKPVSGVHRLHRRLQRARLVEHALLHRLGVACPAGCGTRSGSAQSSGTTLSAMPPCDDADAGRRVGHVEAVVALGPIAASRLAMRGDVRHHARRGLDRVDRLRRQRRMRRPALDAAAPAVHALVRDRRHHARRFADDAQAWRELRLAAGRRSDA